MSYHNIPSSARQSTTNAQGQTAPPGYHYMPDGSLMSDAEHLSLYGSGEIIRTFILDTTNIRASGEKRKFAVTGSGVFSLEIKNEDNYYYNFITNTFQAAKARLDSITFSGSYIGNITFPVVSDADQYDIYLFAEQGTKHISYNEARFEDGSIDINSSTGSNSLLIQKVIYQTLDTSIILSTLSPNSVAVFSGQTPTTKTITVQIGKNVGKIPFSIPVSAGSTHSFRIDRTPTIDDIIVWTTRTVGSAPSDIPGEDIYPNVSNTDTVDGAITGGGSVVKVVMDTNVADKMVVGDKITAATSTDEVDGAVTSGIKVVMNNNVAGKMAIGDQITGYGDLDKKVVTVAALNPDGDNVKEFSMSEAVAIADAADLIFTPKCNRSLTTVVALNPDTDNVKEFSMSQNIGLIDGVTLSFSNQMNYNWPLDNIDGLTAGMIPLGGNVTSGSAISSYEEILTDMEGTYYEKKIVQKRVEATDKLGVKPTTVRDATTNLLTTTQTGNVTFNQQQKLVLASDTIKLYSYGPPVINALTGWDIELSDIEVALTKPTALTTAAVINSTSVPIDDGDGIMDDVSTVSSINIDSSVADPTVTTIGSYSGTTATLTLSAAQTLESGETLTFDGAGRTITITGNIEIKQSGEIRAGWDRYLYFDLERFLTATDES